MSAVRVARSAAMAACAAGSVTAQSRCVTPSSVTVQASGAWLVRREVRQPGRVSRGGEAPVPAGALPSGQPRPAVVDEQDGLKVAARRLHQLPPPGDRPGHHPFMRVHRVRPYRDKPDEAALHPAGARAARTRTARASRRPRARPPPASRAAARRRPRPPPARPLAGQPERGTAGGSVLGAGDGRMSRTTLYGEAASSCSRVPGPITSYGGDVTFASPPTRDRS